MSEPGKNGMIRAMRQYMPHIAQYDDATVEKFIREVYESGDAQRIGRFVDDVRTHIPRFAQLPSDSAYQEINTMFGFRKLPEPKAPPAALPQPARGGPQDYLQKLYSDMFAGREMNPADMGTVMSQVQAPGMQVADRSSVMHTVDPATIQKGLKGAEKVEQAREQAMTPGSATPTPDEIQKREFGSGINKGIAERIKRAAPVAGASIGGQQVTPGAQQMLPSLYEQMANPGFQTPDVALPSETLAPVQDMTQGMALPPAVWEKHLKNAKSPQDILKNIRAWAKPTLDSLVARLDGLPPQQYEMDPLVPTPVPVGDEYTNQRRTLQEAIKHVQAIMDAPKNMSPENALQGIVDAFAEAPTDVVPALGDVSGMMREAQLAMISDKIAKDTATPDEKALYDAAQMRQQFEGAGGTDAFYQAGRMIPPMVSYGGAFALLKGVRKTGERFFTRNLIRAFGGKQGVRQASRMIAPIVGGATAGAVDVPGIARGMMDRMQDTYQYGVSPAGEIIYKDLVDRADPAFEAALKSLASRMAEYGTEQFGETLVALRRSFVGRVMKSRGIDATDVQKAMAQVKEGIGWQGVGYEIAEEEVNEPIQSWIDGREYDFPLENDEGRGRLLSEIVGIGLFGTPFSLINAREKRIQKKTDELIETRKQERTDQALDAMEGAPVPLEALPLQDLYAAMAGADAKGIRVPADVQQRIAQQRMQGRMGETVMDSRLTPPDIKQDIPEDNIPVTEPQQEVTPDNQPDTDLARTPAAELKGVKPAKHRAAIIRALKSGELDPIEAARLHESGHPNLRSWQAYQDANKPLDRITYKGKKVDVVRTPDGVDLVDRNGDRFTSMSNQEYADLVSKRENQSAGQKKAAQDRVIISKEALTQMPATSAIFGLKVGDQIGGMFDNVYVGENQVRKRRLVDTKSPDVNYDKIHEFLAESDNPQHTAWAQRGTDFEEIYNQALEEIAKYQGGQIRPGKEATDNPMQSLETYLGSLKPDQFVGAWQGLTPDQKKSYLGDEYEDLTLDEIAETDRVFMDGEWYDVKTEGGPEGEIRLEDGTTLTFDRVFDAEKKIPIEKVEKGQQAEPALASQAPDQVRAAEDVGAGTASVTGEALTKDNAVDTWTSGRLVRWADNPEKEPVKIHRVKDNGVEIEGSGRLTFNFENFVLADASPVAQPWEMTKSEHWAAVNEGRIKLPNNFTSGRAIEDAHRREVRSAIASGKDVPAAVLQDYPDLVKAAQPQEKGELPQDDLFGAPTTGKKQLSAEDQYGLAHPDQLAAREKKERERVAREKQEAAKAQIASLKTSIAQYRRELRVAPAAQKAKVQQSIQKAQKELARVLKAAGTESDMFTPQTDDAFAQPEAAPARRQPWQMTQREFMELNAQEGVINDRDKQRHRNIVQQAVNDGQPVPDRVLTDYPDMQQPEPEQATEPKWEYVGGDVHTENMILPGENSASGVIQETKAGSGKYRLTYIGESAGNVEELDDQFSEEQAKQVLADYVPKRRAFDKQLERQGVADMPDDLGTVKLAGNQMGGYTVTNERKGQRNHIGNASNLAQARRFARNYFNDLYVSPQAKPKSPKEVFKASLWTNRMKLVHTDLPNGDQVRVALFNGEAELHHIENGKENIIGYDNAEQAIEAAAKLYDRARDIAVARKEGKSKPTDETPRGEKIPKGWTYIGENEKAESLFTDERGNRAVMTERGMTARAPVPLIPTRQGVIGQPLALDELYERGRTEFLTPEEVAEFRGAQAEPQQKPASAEETSTAQVDAKQAKARAELEELKKKFLKQTGNKLTSGVDPEAMATAVQIALKYGEIGILKFEAFARDAIELVGDAIRPYLKGAYMAAKESQPDTVYDQMDEARYVRNFDLDTLTTEQEPEAAPAKPEQQPIPTAEQKTRRKFVAGDRVIAAEGYTPTVGPGPHTVIDVTNTKDKWGNDWQELSFRPNQFWDARMWQLAEDATDAGTQADAAPALDAQSILSDAGLVIRETTTKNGKPVWEVTGNTKEHKDMLKRLGARWYGPKKSWSFYKGDPTADIARELAPDTPATQDAAAPTTPTRSEPPAPATKQPADGHQALADRLEEYLSRGQRIQPREMISLANSAFGGTMGEGTYTAADMYDALELAINRRILTLKLGTAKDAEAALREINELRDVLTLIPTQRIRTEEKDEMQQFSTVPHIAYLASWVANVNAKDTMLEPSAGIGGLAVFSKNAGAKIIGNELAPRRADLLRSLGIGEVLTVDAEQLDNLLPTSIKPTVIVMNPPFSSTSRMKGQRMTANATLHLDQALRRLEPGGRLVAVLGEGMTLSQASTDPTGRQPTGRQLMPWWKKTMQKYNVRANIGIAGREYQKYGTGWPTRIVIIDKTGPTEGKPFEAFFATVEDAINSAEIQEIRNGRPDVEKTERPASQSGRESGLAIPRREDRPDAPAPGAADTMGAGERRTPAERGPEGGSSDSGVPARGAQPGDRITVDRGERSRPRTPREQRAEGGSAASPGSVLDGNDPRFRVTSETRMRYTADPKREDQREVNAESTYEEYVPQRMDIAGAQPHPGNLVESAAMASVEPPAPTYVPMLSQEFIESGTLSNVQLEAVIYAGQAHSQRLANRMRRGFFIGDGTGVGKGRELAGIMLDNWNQRRRRHIWITKNQQLYDDAVRDVKAVFGEDADAIIHNLSNYKIGQTLPDEGIIFITYNTLIGKSKKTETTRIDQVLEWAGENFNGVIAFDEAHKMGSALDMKGKRGMKKASKTALAGIGIVEKLPEARAVYASATGATEVDNLGYLDRLGLWGAGTAFENKRAFVDAITAGGIASMELAARDMKALGLYLARSLSYGDVTYDTMQHALSTEQAGMYGTLVDSWRLVFENFHTALEVTAGETQRDGTVRVDGRVKGRAMSAFWGANQRFWSQIITSMKAPTMIADIEKQIEAGNAVVIQLVNTFEAQQGRKLKDLDEAEDLEMLDMTPREGLMQLVEKSFPVNAYEVTEDENGNKITIPILDKKGNPVQDREAVRMRDELLDRLASVRVPDSPLDMIVNTFGPANVAEITGRRRRVVRTVDSKGRQKTVVESRTKAKRDVELEKFRNDKIQILVFSDAGGTGASYHADRGTKNQRKRYHYVFQPGWIANNAVQGFGRTHRTNQASAPHYILVTTDLPGERRFISSIAKRLQQLGALTRGQRDASSGGLFGERDNLEGELARDAMTQLYKDLHENRVEGMTIAEFEDSTGLTLRDDQNNLKDNLPPITQFLNRMLNMPIETQTQVFEALSKRIDSQLEAARRHGTLDVGMETVKAQNVSVDEEQTVFTDDRSGAQTKYMKLTVTLPTEVRAFESGANQARSWVVNRRSGRIYAVSDAPPLTQKTGRVIERYFLDGVTAGKMVPQEDLTDKRYQRVVDVKEAREIWSAEYEAAPRSRNEDMHLITGALLPVWDRIDKDQSRIKRVFTDDGRMILGRVIPEAKLKETLTRLGAEAKGLSYEPKEVVEKILDSNYTAMFSNNWRMRRSIVDGEERIEFMPHSLRGGDDAMLVRLGAIRERRDYRMHVYLPTGIEGARVLQAIYDDGKVIVQMDQPDTGEEEMEAIAATVHHAGRTKGKKGGGGASGTPPPAMPSQAGNARKKYQPGSFTLSAPQTGSGQALALRLKNDPAGQKIGMRTIVDWLANVVHSEVRVGREQTSRRHPALFAGNPAIIRTQTGSGATYNMHEIGHALSSYLRDQNAQVFRGLGEDLKDLTQQAGSAASANSIEEGIAEWIRLFVTDYNAIAGTPLTQSMESLLLREVPEIYKALRDANRLHYLHIKRGVRAMRNSINRDKGVAPAMGERFRDGFDMLLFRAVASRHAIEHIRRKLWRGWKRTIPAPKLSRGRWIENLKSIRNYLSMRKEAEARARQWEAKMRDSAADMSTAYATVLRLPQEIDYYLRGTGKTHRGQRIVASGMERLLTTESADALENAGYYVPPQFREISSMGKRFRARHGDYIFFDNRLVSDLIADIGNQNWEAFQDYAWDRTDLFRARKLKLDYPGYSDGITTDDLEKSVKEYEKANPAWSGYYDELNQYMNNLAVIAVAGGLITTEQAVAMKEKHEQYIPLLKEREREMTGYGSSGGVYISAKYHRAFGSELPKIPLLNAIEIRTRQVLSAYYHNRMALSPVKYAEMIRGDNTIPYDVRKAGERVAVKLRLDMKKLANVSDEEAKKIIADYLNAKMKEEMKAAGMDPDDGWLADNAVRPSSIELHWSGMGIFRATDPNAVHVVAPMVDGERVFYQIEDPVLYEFFARTGNPKGMAAKIVQQWVLPIVSPWKRQITQTLKFVFGNIPRDVTTALFTGKDIQSLVPGYYHISGMIYKMTGQVPDSVTSGQLLSRAYETAFDPAQLLRMNAFQQVLSEGLLVPGWGVMSRGERLHALAMDAPGKLANLVIKPAELLLWATGQRKLAELSEESARLGAYYAAKKRGLSDEAAQMEYDLITGFFADHPGNSDLATFVRLPGFLNPTNQIMYEWMMRLSDPDAKARHFHWMKIAYIGALTAVGWAINTLLMGDDEYNKLKERTDEERFHFMPLGGIFKVPFDNGPLGATQMFTWNMMDSVAGGTKLSADRVAKEFLGKMIAFPTSPVEFLQPQMITFIENLANYKFYWQKQIVPQFMLALPPEEQYFPNTPEAYRIVGEYTGWSPLKVQHAIRSGVSPLIDDTIKLYESILGSGPPIRKIDQIPGISTRMQHEPMGWYSRSVQEVAEKSEIFQQTISSLKKKYDLPSHMKLIEAGAMLDEYYDRLDARDQKRLDEAVQYVDYYRNMNTDEDSIEKMFKAAKEARKAQDWEKMDGLLRDMVWKAQQLTQR